MSEQKDELIAEIRGQTKTWMTTFETSRDEKNDMIDKFISAMAGKAKKKDA